MSLTLFVLRAAQAGGLLGEPGRLWPQDGASPGVKVPNPPASPPPGLDAKMNTLLSWGKYGVLICGLAGLFICGGQMAIGRKNRSSFAADGATGIPWVLGGLTLAVSAAGIVGVFFT
ncbi:hypothetical protein [Actinomadura montaniterrae]|uniref:hypothetical protein n=1 Tax=Actinomadura montaniterrae TaxID=1803903 RepID=UPI001CEF8C8E|nr:hypothetical protein [Actinomadura montaniterrae]